MTLNYHLINPLSYAGVSLASLGFLLEDGQTSSSKKPVKTQDIRNLNRQYTSIQIKHYRSQSIIYITAHLALVKDHPLAQMQLQAAINYWNSQSGKFVLEVKQGKKKVKYPVHFDLREASGIYNEQGFFVSQGQTLSTGIVFLEVVSREAMNKLSRSGKKAKVAGYWQAPFIYLSEDMANDPLLGIHELGHVLGAKHQEKGIMQRELSMLKPKLSRKSVKQILQFSGLNEKIGAKTPWDFGNKSKNYKLLRSEKDRNHRGSFSFYFNQTD